MYDHAFTQKTLEATLKKADFPIKIPSEAAKQATIASALNRSQIGFQYVLNLRKSTLRNRTVYSFASFGDELAVRKATNNIRVLTGLKQQNRNIIVRNLAILLREAVAYRVYRFDIKSFYESVGINALIEGLEEDTRITGTTLRLVKTLLTEFSRIGGRGLPRGLAISATLAEYILRPFDKGVKEDNEVFFYSRFVDDIIIITSGSENQSIFQEKLVGLLPQPLRFHHQKRTILSISKFHTSSNPIAFHSLDYLGYIFVIPDFTNQQNANKQFRDIEISISKKKLNRFKTKLVRSFLDFDLTGDFQLLWDRVRMLTGNYSLKDNRIGIKRAAGIYYNYRHASSAVLASLTNLDKFLQMLVNGSHRPGLRGRGRVLLNNQKKQLLAYSFKHGFNNRSFAHFRTARLERIVQCWKYQ